MSSARENGIIEQQGNRPVTETVERLDASPAVIIDSGVLNRSDPVSAAIYLPGRVEVHPWVPRRAWSSVVKSRMSFHFENLVARLVGNDRRVSMTASTALASSVDVESFIYEYFDAWGGTDEDRIMSYYAENVTVQIPGTLMQGRSAVREQFLRPFITAFPGNRHVVKNWIFGRDIVVVEWTFQARHTGPFAGHPATEAAVQAPGCGVYEYDSAKRQITAARIYFDVGMILKQVIDPRDALGTHW